MEEKWKRVDFAPQYEVSDQGNIRNKKGQILKPCKSKSGHLAVNLAFLGKSTSYYVHRVVAQIWIDNSNNLPLVNHINGIRTDNRVSNLEWASHQDNAQQVFPARGSCSKKVLQCSLDGELVAEWKSAIAAAAEIGSPRSTFMTACCLESIHKGFIWKYKKETFPYEDWRTIEYNGKEFEVSSIGRVRDRRGRETFGSKEGRYMRYGHIGVHRLIATAFCERAEGKDDVNHKDGDPGNNRADNLEWVTKSENSMHAFYGAPEGKCSTKALKPVRRYLFNGSVQEFLSAAEAQRSTGISSTHILEACRGTRKGAGGCAWEFIATVDPILFEPLTDSEIWEAFDFGNSVEKSEPYIPTIPDDDAFWTALEI